MALVDVLKIYKDNPTANATDGTAVSTDASYLSPVAVELDASKNETKTIKLAIRADSGYKTTTGTTLCDSGDTYERWSFSLTENGTYADTITFGNEIGSVNTIFWAQASSSSLENPILDRSVSLKVNATVNAV